MSGTLIWKFVQNFEHCAKELINKAWYKPEESKVQTGLNAKNPISSQVEDFKKLVDVWIKENPNLTKLHWSGNKHINFWDDCMDVIFAEKIEVKNSDIKKLWQQTYREKKKWGTMPEFMVKVKELQIGLINHVFFFNI